VHRALWLIHSETCCTTAVIGVLLIVAGFLLKISILRTAGIIALIIGVALTVMGSAGHAIGGRRTYYQSSFPSVAPEGPPPSAQPLSNSTKAGSTFFPTHRGLRRLNDQPPVTRDANILGM